MWFRHFLAALWRYCLLVSAPDYQYRRPLCKKTAGADQELQPRPPTHSGRHRNPSDVAPDSIRIKFLWALSFPGKKKPTTFHPGTDAWHHEKVAHNRQAPAALPAPPRKPPASLAPCLQDPFWHPTLLLHPCPVPGRPRHPPRPSKLLSNHGQHIGHKAKVVFLLYTLQSVQFVRLDKLISNV